MTNRVRAMLVAAAAALVLGACSQVRWVAITSAAAADPSSMSLTITIDGCAIGSVPDPRVTESDTEVHLLIDLKLDYGNTKACLSGAIVQLKQPIGARKVIDDRRHRVVPLTWSPTTTP